METVGQSVKQLLADLRNFDKLKRRNAVVKLGLVGSDEAIRALIVTVGNSNEDLIVRGKAALMLGKLRDIRAVPALIEALNAPGFQTPVFAAEALGKIGDKQAIQPLLAITNCGDGDSSLKKTALEALRRLEYESVEA